MSLPQMSVTGGALILFTVVIRAVAIHHLPKTAFLALWTLAALRLLLPLSLPLPFNLPIGLDAVPDVARGPFSETVRSLLSGESLPPYGAGAAVSGPAAGHGLPLVLLWLVGAFWLALRFSLSYVRSMGKFRMSIPDDTPYIQNWLTAHQIVRPMEVRRSDLISSPLTYGILRPVILLPKKFDRNDRAALEHVLAHEYVHIRRFDAVTKLLFSAVLCIHWVNPLVWLMYVLANRDIELACDEAVIRRFGAQARSAYAMTLIRMEEIKSGIEPFCNCFCKNAMEERIMAIMRFKQTSVCSAVLALILVLAGGTTLAFTTSVSAQDAPNAFSLDDLPQGASVTTTDGCIAGWEPGAAEVPRRTHEEAAALIESGKYIARFSLDDLPAGAAVTSTGGICNSALQPAADENTEGQEGSA